ncbi:MAG: hypothetical protein ACREJC_22300 [Tepidisphaeraceae bacterium]
MRAAFGLVGLLICIGVIVWIMGGRGGYLDKAKTDIETGRKVGEEVNQLAGNARDGSGPAKESATLEPQSSGGKTDSVLVLSVKPGGAYEKFWGLKRNDSIIEIGPLPVKDQITSDADADAFVQEAYQRRQNLTVVRDGAKLTLPVAGAAPQPPAQTGSSIHDQLEKIKDPGR